MGPGRETNFPVQLLGLKSLKDMCATRRAPLRLVSEAKQIYFPNFVSFLSENFGDLWASASNGGRFAPRKLGCHQFSPSTEKMNWEEGASTLLRDVDGLEERKKVFVSFLRIFGVVSFPVFNLGLFSPRIMFDASSELRITGTWVTCLMLMKIYHCCTKSSK